VDLKGGMGGAGSTSIREARRKMKAVRIDTDCMDPHLKMPPVHKALLAVLPEAASCTAFSSSVVGNRWPWHDGDKIEPLIV
jgi:hypothetical protein